MSRPPPPLPSPCIGICRIHAATGWCEGCVRSLDEIARWSAMDNRERLAVLRCLPARRVQLPLPAQPRNGS